MYQVNKSTHQAIVRGFRLGLTILGGLLLLGVVLLTVRSNSLEVHADPIEPPEGYPKLDLSVKTVTPTLSHTGDVTLYYAIEIRNTGAYTRRTDLNSARAPVT